jgi:hypothetical protein
MNETASALSQQRPPLVRQKSRCIISNRVASNCEVSRADRPHACQPRRSEAALRPMLSMQRFAGGAPMTDTLFERGLPSNLNAERFVLGSILLNDLIYVQVAGAIEPDDFSLEKHRRIFARMKDLYDRGERVDRVTVADELDRQGQLQSVDGLGYIVSLDEGIPEIANIESYIRIVREKATLRKTMFACQRIMEQCAQSTEPSEEILQTAESLLVGIGGRNAKHGTWVTPWQVFEQGPAALLCPTRGPTGLVLPGHRAIE